MAETVLRDLRGIEERREYRGIPVVSDSNLIRKLSDSAKPPFHRPVCRKMNRERRDVVRSGDSKAVTSRRRIFSPSSRLICIFIVEFSVLAEFTFCKIERRSNKKIGSSILQLVEEKPTRRQSLRRTDRHISLRSTQSGKRKEKKQRSLSSREPYLDGRQNHFHIFRRSNLHTGARHEQ